MYHHIFKKIEKEGLATQFEVPKMILGWLCEVSKLEKSNS